MSEQRITPHPVAALLSDAQKARVRAATFRKSRKDKRQTPYVGNGSGTSCPLAVAFGLQGYPWSGSICLAMGWPQDGETERVIADFINKADRYAAKDIHALLGVAP